jgi:organic radical activating enzyme
MRYGHPAISKTITTKDICWSPLGFKGDSAMYPTLSKVILMPFNLETVLVYHRLLNEGTEIISFFDNNHRLYGETYCGVPIVQPHSQLQAQMVVCGEKYMANIVQQLKNLGYDKTRILDWRVVETEAEDIDVADNVSDQEYANIALYESTLLPGTREENGIVTLKELRLYKKHGLDSRVLSYRALPHKTKSWYEIGRYRDSTSQMLTVDNIDLKITDVCTLRCKYCGVGNDYMERFEEYEIGSVISTLSGFLDKMDFVRRCVLLGGEPFTYRHLARLLRHIIDTEIYKAKIGQFIIYTNATIVPDDDVLDLIAEAKILIVISDYPKIKTKINELLRQLSIRKIKYRVSTIIDNWLNARSIVDHANAEYKSTHCTVYCPTIENNKYYHCSFLSQAYKLRAIPYDEKNFVNISEITKESFSQYRESVKPGCGWCKGLTKEQRLESLVEAAQQLTEPRIYKKYEPSSVY